MAGRVKTFAAVVFCFSLFMPLRALPAASEKSQSSLAQGLEAYRAGEWTSAMFMLRKAVSLKEDATPETLYMLIMSEIYGGEYKSAYTDCETYLTEYAGSRYYSYVQYQKGRCAYFLGDYNRAVLLLSDFCHENEGHEMYPSALFWIAESFYDGYNYDPAKALYERIVTDFPYDAKASEAQYRIQSIDQRGREEKLIYLLRMTGEEYLAAKEEYERQLKQYKTEGLVGLQRQLKTEQDKVSSLSASLETEQKRNAELQKSLDAVQGNDAQSNAAEAKTSATETDAAVLELKRKAREIQSLMNSRAEE